MLKKLSLHHFILADKTEILFEKGLNIISGETGTGKTMVLQALYLLFGQKADIELIRKGEEKATIEAVIDLEKQKAIYSILDKMGIELEPGEDLIIRREISFDGKNKILINNQQSALYALKEISEYLIEIVSQHSHIALKTLSSQRDLLDRFCELKEELAFYKKEFHQFKFLKEEMENYLSIPKLSDEKIKSLKNELDELESLDFSKEEELIQESFQLSREQEVLEKGTELSFFLSKDEEWMSLFLQQKKEFEKLARLDPYFEDSLSVIISCSEKLLDVHYTIEKHLNSLNFDGEKLSFIDEALQEIKRLKRMYGTDKNEIQKIKEKLKRDIEFSENRQILTEELAQKIELQKNLVQSLGSNLMQKRMDGALALSTSVKKHLHTLNMQGADFKIAIEKMTPHEMGIDKVQFLLEANPHEGLLPIDEGASGGELARLILGVKVELASLESQKILILDEIDANIGGTTATLVGEMLKSMGKKRQILCITHFPQVALFADHHLKIIKSQKDGRTQTEVNILKDSEKNEELLRMLGGKTPIIVKDEG